MLDFKEADWVTFHRTRDGDSMYIFFLYRAVLVHHYAISDYGYYEVQCPNGEAVTQRKVD
jgi:hypothetical protein